MSRKDPWDIPEWRALKRESQLVRHLLGSGITSIGKANYADKAGEYYTSFFALTVGIERLAKLVLVTDFAIKNNGKLPKQAVIREFGHQIAKLLEAVDQVAQAQSVKLCYPRPRNDVSDAIVDCLDAFTDAKRGRYANFQALGEPNFEREFEPIRKWWAEVAELMLKRHFRGTQAEEQVHANAALVHQLMSPCARVLHSSETGEMMTDVRTASTLTEQTGFVRKYGRFYTASIIRWLSDVFSELSQAACYTHGIDAFFGHKEFFDTYRVDDGFLKSRKVWPMS
jgi:hypothetical protein